MTCTKLCAETYFLYVFWMLHVSRKTTKLVANYPTRGVAPCNPTNLYTQKPSETIDM